MEYCLFQDFRKTMILVCETHTHTHTYTHKYIYIYAFMLTCILISFYPSLVISARDLTHQQWGCTIEDRLEGL